MANGRRGMTARRRGREVSTDRFAGLLSAVGFRGPTRYLFGHATMLDSFCEFLLAQIE
jgi:hypothetical protein